jgi:hypothetical protein
MYLAGEKGYTSTQGLVRIINSLVECTAQDTEMVMQDGEQLRELLR